MRKTNFYLPSVVTLAAVLLAAAPGQLSAATAFYKESATFSVGNVQMKIMAGSATDNITIGDTSVTVSVPAGEAFDIRAVYPTQNYLENDALFAMCSLLSDKDNQMLIRGPKTVTITPNQSYRCDTNAAATSTIPIIVLDKPSAGEKLAPGGTHQLFWQTSGRGATDVRIRLSTDGGTSYPTEIATVMNNGFYEWKVPTIAPVDTARLRLDGLNGAKEIAAFAVSPVFSIGDTSAAAAQEQPAVMAYDPVVATAAASSIDIDKGWYQLPGADEPLCPVGLRIKTAGNPAVYFCGADGKRHAFPNQKIHDSWYSGDFAGVVNVTADSLARVALGPNVTYRPGVRMVKIQTDPKVYAVDADGVLRWVATEEAAKRLYGDNWNQMIDDVSDAFFADYVIGDPIE